MFIVFVPLRHLRKPNRAATGYGFDRAKMQRFVRHLRRCCVGEEIELTATAWIKQGAGEPLSLGMLINVDGDAAALEQFHEQCREFKVALIPAGTKEQPEDLLKTAARHGMMPVGTKHSGPDRRLGRGNWRIKMPGER